jgi:hypothetical protein
MATIEDAFYAVVQGSGSADDKIELMHELRQALPADRWTTRWVIWGLIFVVVVPIVGLTVSFTCWTLNPADVAANKEFNVSKLLPQGLVSLARSRSAAARSAAGGLVVA